MKGAQRERETSEKRRLGQEREVEEKRLKKINIKGDVKAGEGM